MAGHSDDGIEDANAFQEETDTGFEGQHTLPFNVMGTCYSLNRQDVLEEGYLNLHNYNRNVYAKLEKEPDCITDSESKSQRMDCGTRMWLKPVKNVKWCFCKIMHSRRDYYILCQHVLIKVEIKIS